jgi:hypothetical protein
MKGFVLYVAAFVEMDYMRRKNHKRAARERDKILSGRDGACGVWVGGGFA